MTKKAWALLLILMALLMVTALAEDAEVMPILIDPANCDGHESICSDPYTCLKCGATYDGSNIVAHQGAYQHDENSHWLECACGFEKHDPVPHGKNCNEANCSTCNTPYDGPNVTHIGSLKDEYTEDEHWQECPSCNKEVAGSRGRHVRDCRAAKCSYCPYGYNGDNVVHAQTGFKHDSASHWTGCLNCEELDSAKESHSVTCANPNACVECGASVSGFSAPHTVTGGYEHDADSHWQVCDVCGQEINKSSHSFGGDGEPCSVCGAANGSTTTPDPDDPDPDDPDPDNPDPDDPDPDDPDPDNPDPDDPDPDDPDPDDPDPDDPDPDDPNPDNPDPDNPDPDDPNPDNPDPGPDPDPEVTEKPETTDSPEPTESPDATESPAATDTPAPAETPEETESPAATDTPAPAETPRPKGTLAPEAGSDSFLSRFQANSEMAAGGDILSGNVEETITLVMEAAEEEAGFAGSELVIYAVNSRNDGVAISLNCQYEPEGMLNFRIWQESIKEVDALRATESFGSFVGLAQALVQALMPEKTAEDVDAIIVAILQSGFDGTLESEALSTVSFDEDIKGEVIGYLAQEGYEIFLILRDDGVNLLVREIN